MFVTLRLTCFFVCMFFCVRIEAQLNADTSSSHKILISGIVQEKETNKPIEGATIALQSKQDIHKKLSGVSDANGNFSLMVKDTGNYIITVTSVGYREQRIAFHVLADVTNVRMLTIAMQRGVDLLAEVVVNAERPLIEHKADRLIYNAERDPSSLGGTAADVLRNVPMLSVDDNGNVQLRGSSNIRVLINNRPSNIYASSIADALRQIPAEMVKSVEVITSPGAKYDAEGTAGIVNIITKKNLMQGVTGSVLIVPGNVSTIGNAGLNFRRPKYGISFSTGINQFYNNGNYQLERVNFLDQSIFRQDGKTKNRNGYVSPRVGFDVTLNAHNSISGGVGYTPSYNKVRNEQIVSTQIPGGIGKVSNLHLLNATRDINYDINFDYLHTFKDPQKEFSLLTYYAQGNTDNEANQDELNSNREVVYLQRNLNKSLNVESTIQADYTHPFKNKTLMEVGGKIILREASSDVDYRDIFPLSGNEITSENIFSYHQNVVSAYMSYAFKIFKEVQFKVGTRYEKTTINADYKTRDVSFKNDYGNLIPSINAAYTWKTKHTFRFGFSQRLQRPQLFFLNPYMEVLAPKYIRQGNPQLKAEIANLYELGYSTSGKAYSFNASIWTRLTNDAISPILSIEKDTTYMRFLNIASNKTTGFSFSVNTKPVKSLSVSANSNVYYVNLQQMDRSSTGWMYQAGFSYNLDLGKGWGHSFNGSFNSRRITLQGRMASFYYHNTTLRKSLFNKKGSLGINLANPFMKGTRFKDEFIARDFYQVENSINYTRGIRLSFSYRFGSLQNVKTPRKARKEIRNDDALRSQ